jgi:hypothetical protein
MLLVVCGLSIMGSTFMEVGHELLHHVKNTIHHHDHGHHHSLEEHYISMHTEDLAEDATISGVCSFFLYFENPFTTISLFIIKQAYAERHSLTCLSVSFIPFIPPPIS